MTYSIIRVNDNAVVEDNLTEDQANSRIIFYDSEEEPHKIQKPDTHD